jgi:hypothetical protein
MSKRALVGLFAALALVVATIIGVGVNLSSVSAAVETPYVVMAAGDIAESGSNTMLNATSTGDLIREGNPDLAIALGDNAYPDGSASDYTNKYNPTWGSFKSITKPTPGNHEYHSNPPSGYLGYFGQSNVTNSKDGGVYYAYDMGNGWRGYSLNSEISMSSSSAQATWLKADLAANPGKHILAYWHQPRYTSPTEHGDNTSAAPIWAILQGAKADIVLEGHNHQYERFAKMNSTGSVDASGIRSFIVGSGGNQLYTRTTSHVGSEFFNATDYGVIKLKLNSNSYSWEFLGSGRGYVNSTHVNTANKNVVLDSGTEDTNITVPTGTTTSTTSTTSAPPTSTTTSSTTTTTTAPPSGSSAKHFITNESGQRSVTSGLGYNVHDTGMSVSTINGLPAGDQAMVWVGVNKDTCAAPSGTTSFISANATNPRIYGYYLFDEPADSHCVSAIKALADAIPSGQKAFVELTDYPGTYAAYAPANSHLDLIGIDPYPCHDGSCDLNEINTEVTAALAAGIPKGILVPTFQAFGGGSKPWDAPTASQLQSILDRWESLLPNPQMDYTYSWSTQSGYLSDALSTRTDWQDVMKRHNTSTPTPKTTTPTTTTSTTTTPTTTTTTPTTTTTTPTTTTTTTTTPPTTTTTTPPPVDNATRLVCPVVNAPTVGQTVTCTFQ